MRNTIRQALRTRVLPSRGIRRAHIIGCARSGTTMLHYAMAAFENVILNQVESDLHFTPSIRQSIKLCRKPAGSWLVTKREFGWFEPSAIEESIDRILEEKIAIINIVRDPWDVLVSRHAGKDDDKFYVEPERWKASVDAGRQIMQAAEGHVPAITLRYEDIVLDSASCEAKLIDDIGFTKNPNTGNLSQLADNMKKTGTSANPWMKRALHTLRNFDERSVGSWQDSEQKRDYLRNLLDAHPELRRDIVDFMQQYGYDYAKCIHTCSSNQLESQAAIDGVASNLKRSV